MSYIKALAAQQGYKTRLLQNTYGCLLKHKKNMKQSTERKKNLEKVYMAMKAYTHDIP